MEGRLYQISCSGCFFGAEQVNKCDEKATKLKDEDKHKSLVEQRLKQQSAISRIVSWQHMRLDDDPLCGKLSLDIPSACSIV